MTVVTVFTPSKKSKSAPRLVRNHFGPDGTTKSVRVVVSVSGEVLMCYANSPWAVPFGSCPIDIKDNFNMAI